jgi:hypothetical protein
MVSIPERKLDSASSCGGLGVVDLEGMGVMDLENPFSLESFGSVGRGDTVEGFGRGRAQGTERQRGADGNEYVLFDALSLPSMFRWK